MGCFLLGLHWTQWTREEARSKCTLQVSAAGWAQWKMTKYPKPVSEENSSSNPIQTGIVPSGYNLRGTTWPPDVSKPRGQIYANCPSLLTLVCMADITHWSGCNFTMNLGMLLNTELQTTTTKGSELGFHDHPSSRLYWCSGWCGWQHCDRQQDPMYLFTHLSIILIWKRQKYSLSTVVGIGYTTVNKRHNFYISAKQTQINI